MPRIELHALRPAPPLHAGYRARSTTYPAVQATGTVPCPSPSPSLPSRLTRGYFPSLSMSLHFHFHYHSPGHRQMSPRKQGPPLCSLPAMPSPYHRKSDPVTLLFLGGKKVCKSAVTPNSPRRCRGSSPAATAAPLPSPSLVSHLRTRAPGAPRFSPMSAANPSSGAGQSVSWKEHRLTALLTRVTVL